MHEKSNFMVMAGGSVDMLSWGIISYIVMLHVALVAVVCWALRMRSDYGRLLGLAVTVKVPSEGRCEDTAVGLLAEFSCPELRDALRKKGELVSGVKADVIRRLCESRKFSIISERTARLLVALRQKTGRKLPLAAILDGEAAAAWIRGTTKQA